MQQCGHISQVVFKDWWKILGGKIVEELDQQIHDFNVLYQSFPVVLVCLNLAIGALWRESFSF
jgi:hypothetical protein